MCEVERHHLIGGGCVDEDSALPGAGAAWWGLGEGGVVNEDVMIADPRGLVVHAVTY